MKTFVVIPNWNGEDFIADCLSSLKKQTQEHTVVVVENGSIDDSVKIIEKQFPEIVLLKQSMNHGFAGGVNIGIKYALNKKANFVALFNNDAVADKGWLKNLVSQIKNDKKAGIVTSKLLLDDKKHIDSTGDFYSIWGMPFPRGRNHFDKGQYDTTEAVFAASGGASLYRAEMLRDIGLFDEDFFAYYEDVDISFRAQLAGWNVVYEPTAVAYHRLSGTSSKLGSFSRYHATKNFHYLYVKNMPGYLFWKYFILYLLQDLRLSAGSIKHRQLTTHLKAEYEAIRKLPSILKKRRRIQKNRKVSVGQIDKLLYKKRPPKIPKIT